MGCQSYLSFGQLNLQEIVLKNKAFKCLSGEISIQLSFCKCKTDCFHKINFNRSWKLNELSTYDLICHFISMHTGTHLGVSICAQLVEHWAAMREVVSLTLGGSTLRILK